MKPLFITGIGTGIGKTIWSAIVAEALKADYWKPVQAGFEGGTDRLMVSSLMSNSTSKIHPELYKFRLAASPHISARAENIPIDLDHIGRAFNHLESTNEFCVIEGAGGLMAPLNEKEFVADLIKNLDAAVFLVSRNYLGSINHSLLTASVANQYNLQIKGWLFNDKFMEYEDELVNWTGIPCIGSIPNTQSINKNFVKEHADKLEPILRKIL
jgi:dethiobiotin synthetase